MRPSFETGPPFRRREGTARRVTRRSFLCTPPCEGVTPSGAPSGVSFGVGPRFPGPSSRDRLCAFPGFAVISERPLRKSRGRAPQRPHRQPAPGRQPVLAAGRSPDAARVRGLLATPAGADPLHTSRRNRFASLMERATMGILSYRNIVKVSVVENDGARVQRRCAVGTKTIAPIFDASCCTCCRSRHTLRQSSARPRPSLTWCITGDFRFVMAGRDPAIHESGLQMGSTQDCRAVETHHARVKPAHDQRDVVASVVRQSVRMNVTLRSTRYSEIFPPTTMIFCSLTQAPSTFLSVS